MDDPASMPAPTGVGRRIRVVWVVDQSDAPIGSFAGQLEILRHLDRNRFEVLAVVPAAGRSVDVLAELGARVVQRPIVPSGRSLRYLCAVWSFRRLLTRDRVALLYMPDHTRWRPAELLAARWAGVPVVLHLRTPPDRGRAADPFLRYADAIIGNSAATLQPLRGTVPDRVLHVVYNCIDIERFTPGPARRSEFVPPDTPVVGFVGMFRPEKGIQHFLDMTRVLRGERPEVRYLAVGGDSPPSTRDGLAEAQRHAAAIGVADVVHFTGVRDDIPEIMRALDVLVVPSLTEGFGRVIAEANAVGTPVVATAVGGIPEVIEDGITGVLVPPGDVPAMAAAVRRVLDDSAWRARVAACAPAKVRARFAPATQVRAIEAVWRAVLPADMARR
jgi:glycosyltransferase involved in cell wall biosynthesis